MEQQCSGRITGGERGVLREVHGERLPSVQEDGGGEMSIFKLATMVLCGTALICGCFDPGDGLNPPHEHIDTPETGWGQEACDGGYTANAGPVTGYVESEGWLWLMIEKNGVGIKRGPVYHVGAGAFQFDRLWVWIGDQELPDGEYELIACLSSDSASVGTRKSRRVQSAVCRIALSAASLEPSICFELLQGDSTRFVVLTGTFGPYLSLQDGGEPTYGYTWTVFQNASVVDEPCLVVLDDNGLFFPLKVTDRDKGMTWIVRAENGTDVLEAEIVVRKPDRLGTLRNNYDDNICYWANAHGVPAPILKGQVDKESIAFDTSSFRYELCFDMDYITFNDGYLSPSALESSPYNKYNLQVPDHLALGPIARGDSLVAADTVPAIELYGSALKDLDTDGYYSAWEYLETVPGQNWSCSIVPHPDFVAQTTIASSYGLMQVMWPTAVNPMDWNNGFGDNPHKLFYPDVALDLGAAYLRTLYDTYKTGNWYVDWRDALARYNGGGSNPNYSYADDILMNKVNKYQPLTDEGN